MKKILNYFLSVCHSKSASLGSLKHYFKNRSFLYERWLCFSNSCINWMFQLIMMWVRCWLEFILFKELSLDLIMCITKFNLKFALCTEVCVVCVSLFYEINFIIIFFIYHHYLLTLYFDISHTYFFIVYKVISWFTHTNIAYKINNIAVTTFYFDRIADINVNIPVNPKQKLFHI